jgi:hypothetical protein
VELSDDQTNNDTLVELTPFEGATFASRREASF